MLSLSNLPKVTLETAAMLVWLKVEVVGGGGGGGGGR